jgi:membrane protein DedA with SNARE-associated domain
MHTIRFLTALIEHHQTLAYSLIYAGIIIEGDFFLLSTGILCHLGALSLLPTILFVVLGGLSKTVIGYWLGTIIRRFFPKVRFFRFFENKVKKFLPRSFPLRPFWPTFSSKFIIGANNLVILYSGYHKINYKRFLRAEFLSTLIWAPGLLMLGYFFSYTALNVSHEISRFSLILVVLFILFFLFDKLIGLLYEMFEELYDEVE